MPHEIATLVRTDAGLAGALASSIVRLTRRLRTERQTELTANQLSTLGAMRRQGAITLSALAAHERVRPPSMNRTVRCLEDMGFVQREPDPDDGRQVLLTISEAGEERLLAERRRRDAWLATRLRELSTEDRDVLRKATVILDRLAHA
jgi:DNA-binding MarR family transcriptional regulator